MGREGRRREESFEGDGVAVVGTRAADFITSVVKIHVDQSSIPKLVQQSKPWTQLTHQPLQLMLSIDRWSIKDVPECKFRTQHISALINDGRLFIRKHFYANDLNLQLLKAMRSMYRERNHKLRRRQSTVNNSAALSPEKCLSDSETESLLVALKYRKFMYRREGTKKENEQSIGKIDNIFQLVRRGLAQFVRPLHYM